MGVDAIRLVELLRTKHVCSMLALPSHAATLFRRSLEKGKMTKTPEQMAEEYANSLWESPKYYQPEWSESKNGFLAGYKAAENHFRDVTEKVGPQWISVKDRLPKEGMEVVIGWFQQTASNKLYWTTDVAILTNKVFSGWRVYSEVTHWMELPAPPKEEK